MKTHFGLTEELAKRYIETSPADTPIFARSIEERAEIQQERENRFKWLGLLLAALGLMVTILLSIWRK